MRLIVFGANGRLGSRIVREALERGHHVTAVVRDPGRLQNSDERLTAVTGDVCDAGSVAAVATGHDAVISAVGPTGNSRPDLVVEVARALIDGLTRAGVRRLVVGGGAGSLEVAPGVQLVDAPGFPKAWRDIAIAHRDALDVYRTADLDWTYISPAAMLEPGERTGKYRSGTDQLLTDEKGESRISMEDLAIAFLDEVEKPRFVRRRMTVAY
ncbi:MAG: NAD(P)-dependent oxidoreductase [Desulfomonilaceae bacterium]